MEEYRMSIQAIETEYKGYKFRSRLEARWAVFFDAMNVKWEYEKEGFKNDNGEYYLPDFYLPELDVWCEVKPQDKSRKKEIERACSFITSDLKIRALVFLPGIPDGSYDNSVYWYRCAYYDTLSQTVDIVRVAFEYGWDFDTEKDSFYIIQNFFVGRHRELENPISIRNWECVHDTEMPYEYEDSIGRIPCWSEGRRTEELDEAYRKARQARFSNAKIS